MNPDTQSLLIQAENRLRDIGNLLQGVLVDGEFRYQPWAVKYGLNDTIRGMLNEIDDIYARISMSDGSNDTSPTVHYPSTIDGSTAISL